MQRVISFSYKKIIAVAMLFALVFTFVACKEEPPEPIYEFTEETAAGMIELSQWSFEYGVQSNAITVHHSDENIVFQLSADYGYFIEKTPEKTNFVKSIALHSAETVYWTHINEIREPNANGWNPLDGKPYSVRDYTSYIDITLELDTNIVGYAVIKVYELTTIYHLAQIIKSAAIPKVDGEYQTINNRTIEDAMKTAKTNTLGVPYIFPYYPSTYPLSNMTDEECLEFLTANGLAIPEDLSGIAGIYDFIRSRIKVAEIGAWFPFNYTVTYNFAENIRALTVFYYYQTVSLPMRMG